MIFIACHYTIYPGRMRGWPLARCAGKVVSFSGSLCDARLPLISEDGEQLPREEKEDRSDQDSADRPRHKSLEASAVDQHRAPEVLLKHRSKDETQNERRRIELESQEYVPENAERRRHIDVVQIVVDAVGADA